MRISRGLLVVAVALVASGCGKKDAPATGARAGKGASASERAQLEGMVKVLEAVAGATREQAFLLGTGYAEITGKTCFADAASAEASQRMLILVKCGILCPKALEEVPKLEAGSKWATAVKLCGPARYGLAAGQEHMGSLELAIVAEVAAWYAPLRGLVPDGDDLAKRLDAAAANARIAVPLPVIGRAACRGRGEDGGGAVDT